MSTPIYTTNYRRNLILYWRQYFPNWTIPLGYHVHHIKPKSTFKSDDLSAHHPKNLIALHPDDHWTIHELRGDRRVGKTFILTFVNQKKSAEFKKRCSDRMKGVGNNNYGRKHTDDAKKRTGIASSIRNTGSGNPRAKQWRITDPKNTEYVINGSLISFAKEHNLSAWTLANIAKTNVPVTRGGCIGWFCEYIS